MPASQYDPGAPAPRVADHQPPPREARRRSEVPLQALGRFVDRHIDQPLSVDRLARECDMERSTFTRRFRKATGVTPYRWLLARRVSHARTLLITTGLPLVQVAYATGFSSQSHFTSTFSRLCGHTPGACRRAAAVPERCLGSPRSRATECLEIEVML